MFTCGKYFKNPSRVRRPPKTPWKDISKLCQLKKDERRIYLVITKQCEVYACDNGNGNVELGARQAVESLHLDRSMSNTTRKYTKRKPSEWDADML